MLVLTNADRILRLLPIKSCKPPKYRNVLTVVTKKKKKSLDLWKNRNEKFCIGFLSLGVEKSRCSAPVLLQGSSLESQGVPEIRVLCGIDGFITVDSTFNSSKMFSFISQYV